MVNSIKKNTILNIILLAFLALTVVYVSYPAFADVIYAGHDLWGLCGRIEGIKSAWECGQTFPVVMPFANNGYGYLEFMYPELFLLIPAFLRKCGITMVTALHIYILIINIATAVMTYFAVDSVLKIKESGDDTMRKVLSAASACFFLMAQYRLADVYIRAAIGEAVSMAFLPMVIAGIYHILAGDRKKWWMAVIGLSGLLNSHILSCVIVIPLILIFGIMFIKNIFTDRRWKEILLSVVIFLIVNAWYIIPFIKFYRFGLNTDALIIEDVENHTVLLMQLFAATAKNAGQDYFLRTLGQSALVILILTIIAVILKLDSIKGENYKISLLEAVLIAFAGYLLCSLDIMPWEWIKNLSPIIMKALSTLQFPFRLLTVSTVCLPFMMALCFYESGFLRKNYITITAVILILGVIGSSKLMDEYVHYSVGMDKDYSGFEENVPDDYLPRGVDKGIINDTNTYIFSDNAVINCEKNGTDVRISYDSLEDTSCSVPLFYYPCYVAVDENGKRLEVFQCDDKRLGVILPSGSHEVRIKVKLY